MSQTPGKKDAASTTDTGAVTTGAAAAQAQQMQVNVRLQPASESHQPIFSNFAMAQDASGLVFIDFGFLEPSALPALAKLAQSGGKVPEVINGRLACRIVLGLDATVQLTRQLEQLLRSVQARVQQASAAKEAGPAK